MSGHEVVAPGMAPGSTRVDARVLLWSERGYEAAKWFIPQYEFEDVIAAVDRADIAAPMRRHAGAHRQVAHKVLNRVRDVADLPRHPYCHPYEVRRPYDLFFAVFFFPWSMASLEALRGHRGRFQQSAAYVIEMWPRWLPEQKRYLRRLRDFDHVFVFNNAHVDVISEAIGRQCHFLPMGVDALRFAPPPGLERPITAFAAGRHSPTVHGTLRGRSEAGELTYLYDMQNTPVRDYAEHRSLYANTLRRSQYFFAFRIGEDRHYLTQGGEALQPRHFEGTAAGSILLGSAPRCREWEELFGWEDALIPVQWDGSDVLDVLDALAEQPERVERARRAGILAGLERHDWSYRWETVLSHAGLPPTPELEHRRDLLAARARLLAGPRAVSAGADPGVAA